jgi:hypothetical protein
MNVLLKKWWSMMMDGSISNRKAIASRSLLVTWEVWNELTTRGFHNRQWRSSHSGQLWRLPELNSQVMPESHPNDLIRKSAGHACVLYKRNPTKEW